MTETHRETRSEGGGGATGSGWNLWLGSLLLVGAAMLTGYLAAANGGIVGQGAETGSDSARSVREAHAACGSLDVQEKQECYQQALAARLESHGVAAAMATLKGLYTEDHDVERDAHVYAHHIGIQAYALAPSIAETFSQCSDIFSSGCYHGVIQAYFEDEGSPDSASVNGLCEPYTGSGQSRWILFQCLHGMGHGLTMHYAHDLLQALEACDLLTADWDRQSCYGGAFMENVLAATAPHHPATLLAADDAPTAGAGEAGRASEAAAGGHVQRPGGGHAAEPMRAADANEAGEREPSGLYAPGSAFKSLDREDLHYPCSIVEDKYVHSCYHMQTSAMLFLNSGDIGAAAESCLDAPDVWRATCFQSLGRDITAHALQNPKRVLKECGKTPEGTYRRACYFGAVKALVDWRSAPEPGLEFCRKVKGDPSKNTCYQALGEEIATLFATPEARATVCERSEASFITACRRGARLPVRPPGSGGN